MKDYEMQLPTLFHYMPHCDTVKSYGIESNKNNFMNSYNGLW